MLPVAESGIEKAICAADDRMMTAEGTEEPKRVAEGTDEQQEKVAETEGQKTAPAETDAKVLMGTAIEKKGVGLRLSETQEANGGREGRGNAKQLSGSLVKRNGAKQNNIV